MNDPKLNSTSFLLADCGSTTTTVALFDLVEDSYRLVARAVAPTTVKAPWHDIHVGVQKATGKISEITGRALLTEVGELILPQQRSGAGVDTFGVTISAASPLTAYVTGLLEDVSVASARHALESIYSEVVGIFTLESSQEAEAHIQKILQARPELIFVSGGTDASTSEQLLQLLEILELGASLLHGGKQPDILYAGNRRLRERVTTAFDASANVHIADNVRPSIDLEQLSDARDKLGSIYYERKVSALPGIQELADTVNLKIEATGRAFGTMIDYFGALYRSNVLGIDLGSNSAVIASSSDNAPGKLFIRSNWGMGAPLPKLLQQASPADILQWAPNEYDEPMLRDFIYNKSINPQTVSLTEDEAYLEQAVARVLLRQAFIEAGQSWGWASDKALLTQASFIVLRGNTLAAAPRPGQALLTILDALQTTGVFSVAVDHYGILPMLGLLAKEDPAAVVQILEGGALHELGWVIAPAGVGAPGERALRITVESEDKGEYRIDAEFGELIAVPLAPGVEARLSLKPERKVDVGRGQGRARKITVHGGAVGLVVDVRGRPLTLPSDEVERRNRIQQWHWDMGG